MPELAQHPPGPHSYNELALRAMGIGDGAQTGGGSTQGIVIGFVDYGFDLLHPCLLDASGASSRFKYLWDQNRTPGLVRQPVCRIADVDDYDADAINQLVRDAGQAEMAQSDWSCVARSAVDRKALDAAYDPHANYYGRAGVTDGAHGTMMASIAAGTAFAGFRSPAPFADLIGVQLAVADTDWREETVSGEPAWCGWTPTDAASWHGWRSYDACPQIIHAIRYIYDRASRLGAELVIINLSIGTWAGAHDGQSPVEQAIADVIAEGRRPGATACQVVVGAGNAGADQGHFTATVQAGQTTSLQWLMNRADSSQNKLEIWYDGAPLKITLEAPAAGRLETVSIDPGATHTINFNGRRVGIADHVIGARGRLSRVRLLLHPPFMTDNELARTDVLAWTLTASHPLSRPATSAATGAASTLHAWVERDDGAVERSWLVPHDRDGTLCCLATAPGAIVVAGAYHRTDGRLRALPFSGRGPSPWTATAYAEAPPTTQIVGSGQNSVLAPAYNIWGASSKSDGFAATSGTSAAAALMSGTLAVQHVRSRQAGSSSTDPGGPMAVEAPLVEFDKRLITRRQA
jgi:hypothetical protein